jgi:hypothetical protein
MRKNLRCIGCGKPATDVIIRSVGLALPYHARCAAEAERDMRAIRDRIVDHLVASLRQRGPCDGPLPRADEI